MPIIDFAQRLVRLEHRLAPPLGCDVCRHWHGAVYVTIEEACGPEPARISGGRPEECPSCGRHVPVRVQRQLLLTCRDDGPQ